MVGISGDNKVPHLSWGEASWDWFDDRKTPNSSGGRKSTHLEKQPPPVSGVFTGGGWCDQGVESTLEALFRWHESSPRYADPRARECQRYSQHTGLEQDKQILGYFHLFLRSRGSTSFLAFLGDERPA